jgi:hypothetical protein
MSNHDIRGVIAECPGLQVIDSSIVSDQDGTYALVSSPDGQRQLAVLPSSTTVLTGFDGETQTITEQRIAFGPLNAQNTTWLRQHFAWLRPVPLGLRTSVGLGDRLGLATPGHLRAVRATHSSLAPIPAQQSIREMARTGRTPQQVMDDATWGIFAEGWRTGFGADADHLKTTADIDSCLAAGYTFYTFDPGQYVDDAVSNLSGPALQARYQELPWTQLEDSPEALAQRYLQQSFNFEGHSIDFTEQTIRLAAVKYGRAVAHVKDLYRHLAQSAVAGSWEVEVSVDETELPTTAAEHVYIASEMRRLGIQWVSLAPRFVGRFEKGVDYIGNLDAFEQDIAVHAAIARALGPYKISLHSGSDKFSIYEPAVRQTHGLVHLKTAGTSYLEALRTIAALDPAFMREIYIFARERYNEDRASYHVSAELSKAPAPESLDNASLPQLLNQFDAREILHVTFGSVLTARTENGAWRFYDHFMTLLRTHAEAYADNLQAHFLRHIQSFAHAAGQE